MRVLFVLHVCMLRECESDNNDGVGMEEVWLVSIQFAQQFVTAVTAQPLVGCVVGAHSFIFFFLLAWCFSRTRRMIKRHQARKK